MKNADRQKYSDGLGRGIELATEAIEKSAERNALIQRLIPMLQRGGYGIVATVTTKRLPPDDDEKGHEVSRGLDTATE